MRHHKRRNWMKLLWLKWGAVALQEPRRKHLKRKKRKRKPKSRQ